MSLIKSGKLKAIAVTSPQRLPGLETVPTIAESGYSDFSVEGWSGVVAPAGTPAPTNSCLNDAVRKALDLPDVRAR